MSVYKPTLLLIPKRWRHMGAHSGLRPLAASLEEYFTVTLAKPNIRARLLLLRRRAASALRKLRGDHRQRTWTPFYLNEDYVLEKGGLQQSLTGQFDIILYESLEDSCVELEAMRPRIPPATQIMAISHQPPAWWKLFAKNCGAAPLVDTIITLSTAAATYLTDRLGTAVHFVPHGIDHAFFVAPARARTPPGEEVDVLICGQWLRDLEAIETLAAESLARDRRFTFHLVLPMEGRNTPVHFRLARMANTRWYDNIDDLALLALYQRCHFLYLPLLDATANNVLLEAVACELPVYVSPVGGVIDYVDQTMVNYISTQMGECYLDQLIFGCENYELCIEKARSARHHIENVVNWSKFAQGISRIAQESKRDSRWGAT